MKTIIISILLFTWQVSTYAVTINFDSLDASGGPIAVTNQYESQGVVFQNLYALDISSNAFAWEEHGASSPNVGVMNDNPPYNLTVTAIFVGITDSVEAMFFDTEVDSLLVEMTAYDILDNVLGTVIVNTPSEMVSTVGIYFPGTKKIIMETDSDGSGFDNFTFNDVPIPTTPVYWPPSNPLTINPCTPTSSQPVDITISGDWPADCVPLGASFLVDGNDVYIDVSANVSDDCNDVISQWNFTEQLGPLGVGVYHVHARLVGHPSIPDDYSLYGTFLVQDAVLPSCGFKISSFDPWSLSYPDIDADLGTTGYMIESFEDLDLVPGLTVEYDGWAESTSLQVGNNTLANENTWFDPNYTFNPHLWLAQEHIFRYCPGTESFGIGVGDIESDLSLYVNGTNMGLVRSYCNYNRIMDGGKEVYIRIDATDCELITEVKFAVSGPRYDGLIYDYIAIHGPNTIAGDGNGDCKVNMLDFPFVDIIGFAEFTSRWLLDCWETPNDSRCVPE